MKSGTTEIIIVLTIQRPPSSSPSSNNSFQTVMNRIHCTVVCTERSTCLMKIRNELWECAINSIEIAAILNCLLGRSVLHLVVPKQ